MNITVLIENTSLSDELVSEHGLSLYVEYNDKKILLDAGSSDAFAENAKKLGISLEEVELTMLSHGHYDHSGGYKAFFQINETAPIYAGETARGEYYTDASADMHYIGIPGGVKKKMKKRMVSVSDTMEIAEGVYAIPHTTPGLDAIGNKKHLYQKCGDCFVGDDFSHEISYVFHTDKGLVVMNSCSHGGIATILREVKEQFPEERLYAFVGGLHMKGFQKGIETCTFTEEELDAFADDVKQYGLEHIYTGHCTGSVALEKLKDRLGARIHPLATGMKFEL